MKPAPFDYVAPATLDDAIGDPGHHGRRRQDPGRAARASSRCSNLRLARPAVLVDINRLRGLDGTREAAGILEVGALVRQRALERWAAGRVAALRRGAPARSAHPAIRNRGTVVGNIVHARSGLGAARGAPLPRRRGGRPRAPGRAHDSRRPVSTARRSPPRSTADELVTEVALHAAAGGRRVGLRGGLAPPRGLRPGGRGGRARARGRRHGGAGAAGLLRRRRDARARRAAAEQALDGRAPDAGPLRARPRARRRPRSRPTATSTPPRRTAGRWRPPWPSAP